ncbi:protein disulfide-isomerase A5 [Grus japonensis]|uniref:Protein disulfide-isomerase A5 n=1 Tax=Grus japonensis TaxID=30415 RepID=A0ABC9WYM7_GRUJA
MLKASHEMADCSQEHVVKVAAAFVQRYKSCQNLTFQKSRQAGRNQSTLDDRAAIQRDLSRLEERTDRNFIKFNKDKWKDLQLGRKRLLHELRWRFTGWEPTLLKDWVDREGVKQHMIQQCEGQQHPGLYLQEQSQKSKESDHPLYSEHLLDHV